MLRLLRRTAQAINLRQRIGEAQGTRAPAGEVQSQNGIAKNGGPGISRCAGSAGCAGFSPMSSTRARVRACDAYKGVIRHIRHWTVFGLHDQNSMVVELFAV